MVINSLIEALKYYHSDLAQQNPKLSRPLMLGAIKAFEFTYELSTKFLRRYLEISEPSAEIIDEMSFPNLVRTANERGLIKNDMSVWKKYREKRNITSHTYDEQKAKAVIAIIPEFLSEAQFLFRQLQERIKTL